MSIMQMLQQQFDDQSRSALQHKIGADSDQVNQAIAAALPMLLGGLAKNAKSKQGAKSLWSALDNDHDGNVLNDLGGFLGSGQAQQQGQGIIGHVFGQRQQQAEQALAGASGISSQNAGQLLATLAPVVMGMIGKMQNQKQIGNRRQLTDLLQNESRQLRSDPNTGGLMNMLLDADGDGDVDISDVMQRGGLLGRLFGRRP